MKKLLILLCCISLSLLGAWKARTQLAQDIIGNKKKIATLSQKKTTAEAQLGVLNTTRELQRTIELLSQEIATLTAKNEMLLLTKYEEGPQLKDLIESLEKGSPTT